MLDSPKTEGNRWLFWLNSAILLFGCVSMEVYADTYRLSSPGEAVYAEVALSAEGQLFCNMGTRWAGMVAQAHLSMGCHEGEALSFKKVELLRTRDDITRFPVRGGHSVGRVKAARALYYVEEEQGRGCGLQLMVSDTGVAWRFLRPGRVAPGCVSDAVEWVWPESSLVWYAGGDKAGAGWGCAPLSALRAGGEDGGLAMPVVVQLPGSGGYAALLEVRAESNPGPMRLCAGRGTNTIRGSLIVCKNQGRQNMAELPWCVSILAQNLNSLINSDFAAYLALASNPALSASAEWIKGGRVFNCPNVDEARAAIDSAAALSIEYVMLGLPCKGGSEFIPWLSELSQYARAKSVALVAGYDVARIPSGETALSEFLESIKEAGAVGVNLKIPGGADTGRSLVVDGIRRATAEHGLLLHMDYGSLCTASGARSAHELAGGNAAATPVLRAIAPFVNMPAEVSGSVWWGFDSKGEASFTHRLASGMLASAPLLSIEGEIRPLLEDARLAPIARVVRELTTQWDETRVLEGSRLGELTALARRKGDLWFVAMVNATANMSIVPLPPLFPQSERVRILRIGDMADTPHGIDSAEHEALSTETRLVMLRPYGGFVARIERLR